jgi:hypothetical protein
MKTYLIVILFAVVMVLTGGSCKHDPPVGPKSKCDTCITPCDTCKDTTHHVTSNDSSSHNFIWTQSSISGEAGLSGCWVFGQKNIYVVGGSLWKNDGLNWKDASPSDSKGSWSGGLSGFSMFAFSESDYWLTHSGTIIHGGGNPSLTYSFGFSTINGPLHSSWGTSSSDMYSVGDGGTILHFDGTAWTKMVTGTTKNLYSIWGTSGQNIWAAGWDINHATSEILHYDGTSWQENILAVNGEGYKWGLGEVWACDSAGHAITFVSGSQLFRKTDASMWREDDSDRIGNRYTDGGYIGVGVRGNSSNDLIAAGNSGFIAHWNGRSWHDYPDFFDASSQAIGLSGLSMKDNTFCAVGDKNGNSWIAIGQR